MIKMSTGYGILTPFVKQCFVTSGVTINLAGHGVANGFMAGLLPQLRKPGSEIPINDESGSWIVSVAGFAFVVGNFVIPFVMGKYGRRTGNMVALVPMIIGWIFIALATNITMLILARLLHGLSIGMGTTLGPILIAEYTSPKKRGAFLTLISLMMSIGVLVAHTLGAYIHWQTTAVICVFITLANFVIVLLSPESPSWLADKGKIDESVKVFRWLRGNDEEDELKGIIEASSDRDENIQVKPSVSAMKMFKEKWEYIKAMTKRKEFYKPIIIMIHIYILSQWAGVNILITYTVDLIDSLLGKEVDSALITISVDIQRCISNLLGVYVIKKTRRRTMLMVVGLLAIFAILMTAFYSYLKEENLLPFDHYMIGIILLHVHMMSVGLGTLTFSYIISGELFPMRFRSVAGGISVIFHSVGYVIITKTFPFLFKSIGLAGTYLLYAAITSYSLAISWWLLPETKDRTLREIEEEFSSTSHNVRLFELQPMKSEM
ncbi:facilitated trehalose transporter Tret1-like [Battus philenor]|uniref:facilitated trehalose transporter Tret1-like n=1 Tax=Battus philenor TaxID=42288 RepID=UPI0035D0A901